VARLGGLLGFRDLRDDSLSALEKEEPIRRFRQLALGRTAQHHRHQPAAKEQAFGVLLLGSPDSRKFTPAELRLLLRWDTDRHGRRKQHADSADFTPLGGVARSERNWARSQLDAAEGRLVP